VDLLLIPDGERMSGGQHPLSYVFQTLRPYAIEAIPVVGLLRTEDYLEACRSVVAKDNRGACIRVQREDFADFKDIGEAAGRLLDIIEVKAQNADLILDLRSLAADESDLNAERVIGLVNHLPNLGGWRTFTLAATAFPRNLAGLPPSDFSSILREEWDLWTNLLAVKELARFPTFGDYAISHPETSEVDPRVIRPSASIRYTYDNYWLVPKGRNLRDHGFQQFHEVCRELIQRPEYSGRQFSWGDSYIADCAAERDGPGNLTTWRKVGTSHHLTFVVRQLANALDS
jgi:Beta protein